MFKKKKKTSVRHRHIGFITSDEPLLWLTDYILLGEYKIQEVKFFFHR